MKRTLLFLLACSAFGQWASYRNTPYTNPPYPISWWAPIYESVSKTTLMYVNDQGDSIYSNSVWSWNTTTHTMVKVGTSNSFGMNGNSCPAESAGSPAPWPRDRHPYRQSAFDIPHSAIFMSDGANQVCGFPTDLWKLGLNSNPATDSWTKINATSNTLGAGTNACAFDADDNVHVCYGQSGTVLLCLDDLNPIPGTFTAKQIAAGCVNHNDYTSVTTSGSASTYTDDPSLVYDSINKKIVFLGSFVPGPTRTGLLDLRVYDVPTKTWSNPSPTGMPPAPNQYDPNYIGVPLAFNVNDGKIYYYKPDHTTDGLYTIAYPYTLWAAICTGCGAPAGGPFNVVGMSLDQNTNTLVWFNNSSSTTPANSYDGRIFEYQLLPPSVAPITISEKAATTTTNYPIQIGRVFNQGVLTNYPQAVINGISVTTQADVESRWPDGSVKHAVISFLIPSLASGSTITVGFQNQGVCNCGVGSQLDQATMLGAGYNFDAHIILTNGVTANASARTMLNAGAWTYGTAGWHVNGSINTCVLIADDSLTRAYDVGSDSNKSLRPRFEACFWPTINKVRVRVTLEDSDTIALQDQTYDVQVTTGNTSPTTQFTQTGITHTGMSRWSREYWIGGTPSAIEINHDFAYLISTKQIFNYDKSKTPTATAELALWNGTSHDQLYSNGIWDKYMPDVGGRQEIAPLPEWIVLWAYTQNYQLWEMSTRMAELSMSWPIHFREGTNTRGGSTRYYNQPNTLVALGLPVSTAGHPTLSLSNLTGSSNPNDNITPVGTLTDQGWTPDQSHGFDAWNLVYLLRGEYTDYEEALFWHSYNALNDSADSSVGYGRGPTGAEAVCPVPQVRAVAWELRTRVHTAWAAPDGLVATEIIQDVADCLAAQEGAHAVTTGIYNGNPVWTWQNSHAGGIYRDANYAPSPLGIFSTGDASFTTGINPAVASTGNSDWEENYFIIGGVGRAVELGYAGTAMVNYVGQRIVGELTNPSYNFYQASAYHEPALTVAGLYFTTWAQELTGFTTPGVTTWQDAGNCADCYRYVAMAASAFTNGLTNGQAAWNLISGLLLSDAVINTDPQFAIIPRSNFPTTNAGGLVISGKSTLSGSSAAH